MVPCMYCGDTYPIHNLVRGSMHRVLCLCNPSEDAALETSGCFPGSCCPSNFCVPDREILALYFDLTLLRIAQVCTSSFLDWYELHDHACCSTVHGKFYCSSFKSGEIMLPAQRLYEILTDRTCASGKAWYSSSLYAKLLNVVGWYMASNSCLMFCAF